MSYTLLDPKTTMEDLLSDNWISANANNITPEFTDKSEFVRTRKSYQVLFYPTDSDEKDIGRGTAKDIISTMMVEVRVKDETSDANFRSILQEVFRIIGEYRVAPGGNFNYVTWLTTRDESHRGNHWYRMLITVELRAYNVSKGVAVVDGGGASCGPGIVVDGKDADGL